VPVSMEEPAEWAKFRYRGRTFNELKMISMDELISLLPARQRRSLLRGLTPAQRKLLEKIRRARVKASKSGDKKPPLVKTHVRDMIVLPEMVGMTIAIYDGKEYMPVRIVPEMIGHYLGEYSPTCRQVTHGEPGLKATRSKMFVGLK